MNDIFRVLVEGHNVMIRGEARELRRCGFLQTFWIEADSADVAVQEALQAAADSEFRRQIENPVGSPPVLTIYEVEKCSEEEISEIEANPTGRAFFPEGLRSRLVMWYRRLTKKPYLSIGLHI